MQMRSCGSRMRRVTATAARTPRCSPSARGSPASPASSDTATRTSPSRPSPTRSPTGPVAPGSAPCSRTSWTNGVNGAWRAVRSLSCCPTGGNAATCPCSPSRWPACTGSHIGSSGPTPAPGVRASNRSPPGRLRPSRALTISCPDTASPPSSTSRTSSREPRRSRGGGSMRDLIDELTAWSRRGDTYALATVVDVRGSAPRQPGASMAVSPTGEVVGSVSGGCVEGAVYELATEVLKTGEPVLQTYGISDEDAFSVGLTCGGILDILIRPVDAVARPEFAAVTESIRAHDPVALATVMSGDAALAAQVAVWPDKVEGTLGATGLDVAVVDDARGMLAQGQTGIRHYGPNGERRQDEVAVFVESFNPPPRMLVFGAIDFAAAVARIGKYLGYRVTVCDARPVFATEKRFPDADEVVCEWPHRFLADTEVDERTVITVLTHDPKFDVPLLEVALRTKAGYIGAMGSRRTHDDRVSRLRELGFTDTELARLRSPIGLDLGARTPEETAVSVAAEIVGLRWGGSGRPLGDTAGAIHGDPASR